MRTPSPWTYDAKWCLIMGPHGEEIAAIHTGQPEDHPRREPTAGENAALMCAAPDLLAALEELTAYMGEHGMMPPCRTAAMRLIAKATGKEAAHASR